MKGMSLKLYQHHQQLTEGLGSQGHDPLPLKHVVKPMVQSL